MRTGTKVSIAIAFFACFMVFFLIVFVIVLGIWVEALREFWQYIPETITALLGINGLAFVAVETRKAIEYRAYRMYRSGPKDLDGKTDVIDPRTGETVEAKFEEEDMGV